MTEGWGDGKIWRLKISRYSIITLALGFMMGGNLPAPVAAPAAGAEMSDAEYQGVSEKTNLYVKVITALVAFAILRPLRFLGGFQEGADG